VLGEALVGSGCWHDSVSVVVDCGAAAVVVVAADRSSSCAWCSNLMTFLLMLMCMFSIILFYCIHIHFIYKGK